jgi:hypothetical protein
MDLLPSSGMSDTIHVMNLLSKLERADLERYTDKELDTLRNTSARLPSIMIAWTILSMDLPEW